MEGQNTQTDPSQAPWQFKPGDQPAAPLSPTPQDDEAPMVEQEDQGDPVYAHESDGAVVIWTASEFIAHHKTIGWYASLAGIALAAAIIIFLITKDKISTAVVIVAAIFFGIYAARKPRQIQYRLDDHGIVVGQRQYSYQDFRSFAVVDEGAFSSIVFMPLKRFAPWLTIYYDPADEEKISNLLVDRLPMDEHHHDPVDRLMRRIRF